ncbi:MAG: cell division FtsA domain-containing protein [Candidatus Goldiibacteriota bacterium]|jgi:cell division protein FtsA
MALFALDIGTRKVAGILGELKGDRVNIIDAVVLEHEKRAMLDGQIHSIEDVTTIVKKIKKMLEERNGVTLEKVTTALAGRALYTKRSAAEMEKKGEITPEDISFLELESVRRAYLELPPEKKSSYYCVGYSTVFFAVDGEPMKNPLQHPAKASFSAESIVTFLPRAVLDSMVSVLKNASLSIDSITLEPIAALYVTIPEDMRLLNLALVDVGAGTSDIAITKKGRIESYGMIPKAGDEITESICHEFLVDFNTAEVIKRHAPDGEPFISRDIFNNPVSIGAEQFYAAVSAKADEVARDVADEIMNLNGSQPQAVVMVGGGSSLKILRDKVAENLGLPSNRVGSRTPESVANIDNLPDILKGTEGITPVGILETALFKKGIAFVEVTVNGEKEFIINLDQRIRVLDVLLSRGLELKNLYGVPGRSLSYTANGELKMLRGGHAAHAKVFVNDTEKNLEDIVKQGDSIYITAAVNGEDASAVIRDVISQDFITSVEINGKITHIEPLILLSGKEVTAAEPLIDRADLEIKRIDAASEVLSRAGFSLPASGERDIMITVNGEPKIIKQRNYQLKVNGFEVSADFKVKNLDRIEFRDAPSYFRIKDVLKSAPRKGLSVVVNGKPFEIEQGAPDIMMNGKRVSEEEFIINGAAIDTRIKEEKLILSSLFKTYPLDMQRAKGKMLELKVNGEKAGYTTPISEGSNIEINFTDAG